LALLAARGHHASEAQLPGGTGRGDRECLVTLYCPVVDQDAALSEAEKADRLSAFSSRVMQTLASH